MHFPFCRSICDYCGYETRLITKSGARLVESRVVDEINAYGETDDFTNARLTSLYFGGGTASLLTIPGIGAILDALRNVTGTDAIGEVTLECEPDTIDVRKLRAVADLGVNRISICAQSFDDRELTRLTRKHDSAAAMRLLECAIEAGIENRHVDLMYGFTGQTLDDWQRTLEHTASLPIQHVSAYKLYVFKYGLLDRTKSVQRPDRESEKTTTLLRRMHDLACEVFEEAGFRQYTLTEWARPGRESRYLSDTFLGNDILPLGPSSFGRCGLEVWHNPSLFKLYEDDHAWRANRRAYPLTPLEAFKRDVILGLWMLDIDIFAIANRWGVYPSNELLELLKTGANEGLFDFESGRLSLTQAHRFGVGGPMERMAALDARSWGTDLHPAENSLEQWPTVGQRHSPELNAVLRMARRDPKFFASLAASPRECLDQLQLPLPERDRERLATVVVASRESFTNEDLLTREWAAICAEHRLDTRKQACVT